MRRWWQATIAVALTGTWILALCSLRGSNPYPQRFAMVSRDMLYRSAQPDGAQLRRICARYGVRTVISLRNCRPETDPRIAEEMNFLASHGLAFVHIPSETPPSNAQLRAFLSRMTDTDVAKPVLVHCAAGRTRTGAAVALWRMLNQGWSVDAAIKDADWWGLHDDETAEVVRDFRPQESASGGTSILAPLIDRR